MNAKLLKLAKLILNLGTCTAEDGTVLNWEGELAEGVEVFVEVEGEMQPASDGEYIADGKKIMIADGKVNTIEEVEAEPAQEPEPEPMAEPEPAQEPEPADDKDAKIAELEAENEELKNKIAELEAQVAQKDAELQMSADIAAKNKNKQTTKSTFKSYL